MVPGNFVHLTNFKDLETNFQMFLIFFETEKVLKYAFQLFIPTSKILWSSNKTKLWKKSKAICRPSISYVSGDNIVFWKISFVSTKYVWLFKQQGSTLQPATLNWLIMVYHVCTIFYGLHSTVSIVNQLTTLFRKLFISRRRKPAKLCPFSRR